jgi:hypothetical protein
MRMEWLEWREPVIKINIICFKELKFIRIFLKVFIPNYLVFLFDLVNGLLLLVFLLYLFLLFVFVLIHV